MRLLYLILLPPPVHGSSIMGELVFNSKVINSGYEIRCINIGISDKVSGVGKHSVKKLFRISKLFLLLLKEIVFFKPNCCYFTPAVTGYAFLKDFIMFFLLRLSGVKVLMHLHNKGVSEYSDRSIFRFLYSIFFKNSKTILLSDLLYHDVKDFLPINNKYVCSNALMLDHTINRGGLKNIDNSFVSILYLSNLIESKGVFDLVKACGVLKSKGVDFNLIIVGDEGDIKSQELIDYVDSYDIRDNVFYLGPLYADEKKWVLSAADVFVFPTYYSKECFPLVLLEALQYSLPIISTNEGAILDIVDHNENGYIIEKRNIEELVYYLSELISDPDRRRLFGESSRRKFDEQYEYSLYERKMRNIFIDAFTER